MLKNIIFVKNTQLIMIKTCIINVVKNVIIMFSKRLIL